MIFIHSFPLNLNIWQEIYFYQIICGERHITILKCTHSFLLLPSSLTQLMMQMYERDLYRWVFTLFLFAFMLGGSFRFNLFIFFFLAQQFFYVFKFLIRWKLRNASWSLFVWIVKWVFLSASICSHFPWFFLTFFKRATSHKYFSLIWVSHPALWLKNTQKYILILCWCIKIVMNHYFR